MKSAEEWTEALNAQEGADVNPCNITASEVRAVQADALRWAAEIVNNARGEETDLRSVRDWIKAKATALEKGETGNE